MGVLGTHHPFAAAAVLPNAAAAYNKWIHRMYIPRTPPTHSFQQGMAMLAVKSYVGWADWMSAGRPKPLGSAGNALLGPIDPIDRFRVWCVVPPSVSLSQRLEEYLTWSVSIGATLAPHRPLATPMGTVWTWLGVTGRR